MAHGAFTMALFINNITSLHQVCGKLQHQDPHQPSLVISAILLSICLLLQVIVSIISLVLGGINMNKADQSKAKRQEKLNMAVTVLSFVITLTDAAALTLLGERADP